MTCKHMKSTLSFLGTAGVISKVDDIPDDLTRTILRRIRIFDKKELVPVFRAAGPRAEGRLDVVSACMARVHSELIDFGLDAETLRGLRSFFDRSASLGSRKTQFAAAVDAIKDGEIVILEISLRHRPNPWSKWHAFALISHVEVNERAKNEVSLIDAQECITDRAALKLDLTHLLSAFIEAFEDTAATLRAGG